MAPSKTGPKPRPAIDRLLEKVEWQDGCLVFTGCRNKQGRQCRACVRLYRQTAPIKE